MNVLPLAAYQAGTFESDEFDIPDGATEYLLRLSRCTGDQPDIWPDSQQMLRVEVELYAVGTWMVEAEPHTLVGWHPWGAFNAYGGKHRSRDGSVPAYSWLRSGLHVPLTGRKLRVRLVALAEVRTKIDLEVV